MLRALMHTLDGLGAGAEEPPGGPAGLDEQVVGPGVGQCRIAVGVDASVLTDPEVPEVADGIPEEAGQVSVDGGQNARPAAGTRLASRKALNIDFDAQA